MAIPQCAQTVLCQQCKELGCKFNTTQVGVPVRTQISECQYINANQATRPATPQVRVRKSQPRAQEGTAMGGNAKARELTTENVIKFMDAAITHIKTGTYVDKAGVTQPQTGMHVKLSGFNSAFKSYFGVDKDTNIQAVDAAVEDAKSDNGKTARYHKRGANGGPIISFWDDRPKSTGKTGMLDTKAKGILAAVGK